MAARALAFESHIELSSQYEQDELEQMAATADLKKVLDAFAVLTQDNRRIIEAVNTSERSAAASFNLINVSVAGLQERVAGMGITVAGLALDVQSMRDGKASRKELDAVENRLKEDIIRTTEEAAEDVKGFERMYESLVGEMKDMRDGAVKQGESINAKLDSLMSSREAQKLQIDGIDERFKTKCSDLDERLKKVEPLNAAWNQMLGAKWAVSVMSALISALATWGLFKWIGGSK